MTVDFSPEQERVISQAIAAGVIATPEQVVAMGVEAVRHRLQSQRSVAESPSKLTYEEWSQRFDAFQRDRPKIDRLLTDEDMTRESIYGSRGL